MANHEKKKAEENEQSESWMTCAVCFLLVISGVAYSAIQKSMQDPEKGYNFNIWVLIFFKNVGVLFIYMLYQPHTLVETFAEQKVWAFSLPIVAFLVVLDYTSFYIMAIVSLAAYCIIGDSSVIFILAFRSNCLGYVPSNGQITCVVGVVLGVCLFRFMEMQSNDDNFHFIGLVLCLARSLLKSTEMVYEEWYLNNFSLSFHQIQTPVQLYLCLATFCLIFADSHFNSSNIFENIPMVLGILYIFTAGVCTIIIPYVIFRTNSFSRELLGQIGILSVAMCDFLYFGTVWNAGMTIALVLTIVSIVIFSTLEYESIPEDANEEKKIVDVTIEEKTKERNVSPAAGDSPAEVILPKFTHATTTKINTTSEESE
jgi:hypothetical protein